MKNKFDEDCQMWEAPDDDLEDPMKEESKKAETVLAALRTFSGMVAHVAAIAFTAYMLYVAKPGSSLFSWHPTLMSVAFTCLMVEAILVFSPESSLLSKASRKTKVRVHWILQTCAMVCATIGFIVIVANKIQNGKEHFKSWHGTLGLVTFIYCVVQACCGVFLLYPQAAKKYNWKLIQLKVYHATFGMLGFSLACFTVVLSLYSNFAVANIADLAWFLCLLCPMWCGFIVMNQVTNTYLPLTRKKTAPL